MWFSVTEKTSPHGENMVKVQDSSIPHGERTYNTLIYSIAWDFA